MSFLRMLPNHPDGIEHLAELKFPRLSHVSTCITLGLAQRRNEPLNLVQGISHVVDDQKVHSMPQNRPDWATRFNPHRI